MALTTAQVNAHLRTTMADQINANPDKEVFLWLLRACIRHYRLGGADNQEAGRTLAELLFQAFLNRPPTADDLHRLRRHLAIEADETALGVLG